MAQAFLQKYKTPFLNSLPVLNPAAIEIQGGYGLKLAIVKQIAEAHQRNIRMIASDLDGAKFLISCLAFQ